MNYFTKIFESKKFINIFILIALILLSHLLPEVFFNESREYKILEIIQTIIFIFLILCIFITTENNKKFTLKQIIYLSPYFFFFFFAQDWGRWIFLIFFITFLNYSYSNVSSQYKIKISYLCLAPILLNIFINVPTHLFQDILILDIRPIGFILSSLFTYFYNLIIGPYIIIRYGYNPPIILQ